MKKTAAFTAIFVAAFLTMNSTRHVSQTPPTKQLQTLPTKQLVGTSSYAAKFICGIQDNLGGYGGGNGTAWQVPDAEAGRYSTKINVHNNTGVQINFRKKIILLARDRSFYNPTPLPGGGEIPRGPTYKVLDFLQEDQALEVVCNDIYGYVGVQQPPGNHKWPYIEGFVIFEVFCGQATEGSECQTPPDPLDVEGIYTYKADPANLTSAVAVASGVSISVVVFPVKSNRHVLH